MGRQLWHFESGRHLAHRRQQAQLMFDIVADPAFRNPKFSLSMALGKNIFGAPVAVDLAKMPHLLVAGATGAGKSVSVNAMICSLLVRCAPDQVRMIMIDPKFLELSGYNDIPHLLLPVVTDPKQADVFVDWYARIPTSWGMSASTIGVTSRETQGRWLVRNDVHLALYDRGGQLLDSRQMQTSASHELGHVLGLTGHSKHPGDLMHHSSTQAALSVRDANTLRAVYAMPARITNRPGIHLARYRDSLPPVQLARPHPSYSTTAAGQPAPAYTGYQSPPTAPSTTPPTTSPSEPGFGSVFDTVLDTVFGGRGR